MKRILYYFIIASTLFLTNAASALDAIPHLSFTTTQKVTNVHYSPSSSHNLFFDDMLADITDDDDSNESKSKKKSSVQSGNSIASINTQNFPKKRFQKTFHCPLFFSPQNTTVCISMRIQNLILRLTTTGNRLS